MHNLQKDSFDWDNIERGVPITNDSYFVRHDRDTGLIYDDQGGYLHENFCFIEKRREVTWIQHDQSAQCPISPRDVVLYESIDGELALTCAYEVIWSRVKCYRVTRQQLSESQQKVSMAEVPKPDNNTRSFRFRAVNIVIMIGAILI